ncbi:hypothetical protein [Bosea sp. ANAM02]|uniref:hypothetical protein n=1 Tax=Bosea sp. ANAM02 TaxID=2020412 RepID=UPI00140F2161|nr:hypothetical protein [Bosea sp. ANAM02]BCB22073.1 hypothetical protein OCUBac02_49670 [Bosea sp. ANAM02]
MIDGEASKRSLAKRRVIDRLPAHIGCSGYLQLDGKAVTLRFIALVDRPPDKKWTQTLELTESPYPTTFDDTFDQGDGLTVFMTFVSWVNGTIPNPYLRNPFSKDEIARMEVRWQPHLEDLVFKSRGRGWSISFDGAEVGWLKPEKGGGVRWSFSGTNELAATMDDAETAFKAAWAQSIYALVSPMKNKSVDRV